MGAGDVFLEVRLTYVMPEGSSDLTWDVRVRSADGTTFRLFALDEVDLAEPQGASPGLAAVEEVLERWLRSCGVQLELPFP